MAYDVVIVGAGPAGLSAALECRYLKLETIVIEDEKAGGAPAQSYPWKGVDSYLGFRDMTGRQIANRIVEHVRGMGVEIREMEEVLEIKRKGRVFYIRSAAGSYEAKSVIIATGIRGVPGKLSVPGEELDGVEHFVSSTKRFQGKNVLVVGGGNSAADCAVGLCEAGATVFLAHRRDELRATGENKEKVMKSGVNLMWNTEVESISGKCSVEKVSLLNNVSGARTEIDAESVIVCVGSVPSKNYLEALGVKMEGSLVSVDSEGMTSIPGVFAAGDIVSLIKRIPQALATGERAAYGVFKYIKSPYWE
jgi:thioredoxin reductase (NADPH)